MKAKPKKNKWSRLADGRVTSRFKVEILISEDELFQMLCLVARRNQRISFASAADLVIPCLTLAFRDWLRTDKDLLSVQPGDITTDQMSRIKSLLRRSGCWNSDGI